MKTVRKGSSMPATMEKYIFFQSLISFYLLMLSCYGNALRTEGVCSWMYYRNSGCLSSKFLCDNGKCIDRNLHCNRRDDCGDNSDEVFCSYYTSDCQSRLMRRCPDRNKCIPLNWFCDGIPDCGNNDDERNCGNMEGKEINIKTRALQWLSMQKKQSRHATDTWGSLVDKSAVAFYLGNTTSTTSGKKILKEMTYEVSIQLLSELSRKTLREIPSYDLASFVNAFLVTCLEPRKFHGLDIVRELRSRVDRQNYTNPYVLLALCNAGDTITELDKMKLLDAFRNKRRPFWTDIQAVAVMALACVNKQPGNEVDSDTLFELTMELKQHQYSNGTVENIQTTALVLQALLAADPDPDPEIFDEKSALQQIYAVQQPDGSFGSLTDTYYVLPVLNCMSLLNISSDHCESIRKDETTALQDLTSRSGPKVRVRYSLWIGDNKDLERNLALRVPANMSFYGIMEMAAEVDHRYRFEYVVKNNKPYVNALSGIKDNPEKIKFWLLFTMVKGNLTPSKESPVDVIPTDHEHFVMWYRSGSWID